MTLMKKIYLIGGGIFLSVLGVLIGPKLIPSSVPDHIKVLVTSDPQGARITLDGKDIGKLTPTTLSQIKIKRRYQLELSKQGYQTIKRTLTWNEGDYGRKVNKKDKLLEERVILERSPGQIVVYTDPPGAKVYLNGDLLGATPLNKKDLKRVAGEHMLLIKHPKYVEPIRTIFKWGEESQKSFTHKMKGRRKR